MVAATIRRDKVTLHIVSSLVARHRSGGGHSVGRPVVHPGEARQALPHLGRIVEVEIPVRVEHRIANRERLRREVLPARRAVHAIAQALSRRENGRQARIDAH